MVMFDSYVSLPDGKKRFNHRKSIEHHDQPWMWADVGVPVFLSPPNNQEEYDLKPPNSSQRSVWLVELMKQGPVDHQG